ncbi:MAG TPA: 5'-3' exonuclease H3TH domain-containing protein, partial [Polyangiaceae bacterium]|nr:5'-3' exonuclease H3TH domain-containing protein [Polyangiaceae bacterium]
MVQRPTELPPPGSPETLYVVDLPGYVYRAYHALEPLHNASGEVTHATYGTVLMLTKLVNERKPAYLGVALEGGRTFRDDIDSRYKATRPPPPPDLAHQMKRARQIVEAYRIPVLQAAGFEADDVIATIVTQAKKEGLFVVIASSDKDLMQLVDDRCVMWDAMRDRVYGPPEVVHKFGVGPERVRDLLALIGDTSDNVPGVKGVGQKTAADLLTQFESIDDILAHLDQIKKPRTRALIEEHLDDLKVSRELVSLRFDTPVTFDK